MLETNEGWLKCQKFSSLVPSPPGFLGMAYSDYKLKKVLKSRRPESTGGGGKQKTRRQKISDSDTRWQKEKEKKSQINATQKQNWILPSLFL